MKYRRNFAVLSSLFLVTVQLLGIKASQSMNYIFCFNSRIIRLPKLDESCSFVCPHIVHIVETWLI